MVFGFEILNEVLCKGFPQRASKLPEVKGFNIQIHLIKVDFFGHFELDF